MSVQTLTPQCRLISALFCFSTTKPNASTMADGDLIIERTDGIKPKREKQGDNCQL
jgi:hypothetical protein